jgi:pilus assembly protein Flp/PilA
MKCLCGFLFDDTGATAVEYAVMLAMILMAVIGAVVTVGSETNSMFVDIDNKTGAAGLGQ